MLEQAIICLEYHYVSSNSGRLLTPCHDPVPELQDKIVARPRHKKCDCHDPRGIFGKAKANINAFQASEGTAARFFFNVNRQLDEADPVLYQAKASRKERDAGLEGMARADTYHLQSNYNQERPGREGRNPMIPPRNPHPTVKPIDLTRWLATLLLPPAEYAPRRILIPFAGSGSEMIGAHLAGWEEVTGVEMAQEYCEIAEARLKYWTTRPKQLALL